MWTFKTLALTGLGTLVGLAAIAIGAWFYLVSTVEQPKYASVTQDGAIEIRDYPALVVAEVTRRGDRQAAVRAGFSPLAGYIFARSREGETVSMTAPVTQTPAAAADQVWLIRFVMPAKYTLETLPRAAGDDVRLLSLPAARRAAIRFSGVATDGLIGENEAQLRAWLAKAGIAIQGAPTYAYYNDPWTPGPFRRNEVLFDVAGS
ncbi:heme-binding protein [Bosea sp. AAP35]|uniref:SOUL family heme-binding protein n=1 Tax=Bosea sp. AAP35 TaxID=1523417 RepID=UPI0006B967DA|nr:heme-binding protein [Bosea sp. AAP35]KPF62611.1 heme-binding protein [Bosea sp. AAP35]